MPSKEEKKKIKEERKKAREEQALSDNKQEVVMVFSEDKFYKDPTVPHFLKGKEYVIKGADMIQRWLKRGGVIVKGELKLKQPPPDLSKVVERPVEKPVENKPEDKGPVSPVVDSEPLDEVEENKENN